MRANRFLNRSKKQSSGEIALQITAMADVFTVLLVFLLKSLSNGISGITPGDDLLLPEARAIDQVVEAMQVEISSEAVLVDGKPVTELRDFRFLKKDLESDNTPRSLNSALIAEQEMDASRNPAAAQAAQEGETPAVRQLLVLADRRCPYSTLRVVMASAAKQGFHEFKLVVVGDK